MISRFALQSSPNFPKFIYELPVTGAFLEYNGCKAGQESRVGAADKSSFEATYVDDSEFYFNSGVSIVPCMIRLDEEVNPSTRVGSTLAA
jgi:hypothetical protein